MMGLVDTLTEEQKDYLLETKNNYIKLIKTKGNNKVLLDRIKSIEEELKEKNEALRRLF